MTTGTQPLPPTASTLDPEANVGQKKTGSPNSLTGKKRPVPQPSSTVATALHRVGKDGEPLSEKKLRRLEKNRLSARECRRRKREATENMQGQIALLEGENLRLRLQLQVRAELNCTKSLNRIFCFVHCLENCRVC